jgi:hypothetical protein
MTEGRVGYDGIKIAIRIVRDVDALKNSKNIEILRPIPFVFKMCNVSKREVEIVRSCK